MCWAVSNVSIIFLKRHIRCSQGFYFTFPILHCLDWGVGGKNYQLHYFFNLMSLSKGNSNEAWSRFREDSKWRTVVSATPSMNIGCSSCLCYHSLKVMPCFPLSLYLRIKWFEFQTHRQHTEGPLPIFAARLEKSIRKHYSFIWVPGSCCKFSVRDCLQVQPFSLAL